VGEGEKAVRNEAVTDRKGCELVASAAIMGIVSDRNVRLAGAEAASRAAPLLHAFRADDDDFFTPIIGSRAVAVRDECDSDGSGTLSGETMCGNGR
jgi:hypothetical protein